MAQFRFLTTWELDAPLPAVWDVIQKPLLWPQWWQGVIAVEELEAGDENGVGKLQQYVWRSRLPYAIRFTMRVLRVDLLSRIEGAASGEIEGIGIWHFSMRGNHTIVRYEWDVRTIPFWVNLIAPLARPLIRWNHDQIMNWGAAGLARHLNAQLVSVCNN